MLAIEQSILDGIKKNNLYKTCNTGSSGIDSSNEFSNASTVNPNIAPSLGSYSTMPIAPFLYTPGPNLEVYYQPGLAYPSLGEIFYTITYRSVPNTCNMYAIHVYRDLADGNFLNIYIPFSDFKMIPDHPNSIFLSVSD